MKLTNKQRRALQKVSNVLGCAEVIGGKIYFYKNYECSYTWREVYNLASTDMYPYTGDVKYYRHRKNRGSTRQTLHNENYERFSKGSLSKDENIWAWD